MNGAALFVLFSLTLSLTVTGTRYDSFDEDAQEKSNTLFLLVLLPHVNSSTIASLHHSWLDGASVVPALQLAEEQINNSSHNSLSSNATISIPGYKLELVFANDGCESHRDTLVNLAKELYPVNGRRVVGIIGPACSESATVVSSFTKQMKVSLALLHGAGSAVLADRVQHPYSLGVVGSSASLVQAIIALVERKKWKRIGVLYQESSLYYSTIFNEFCSLLPSDVKLAFVSTISHNFYSISTLKESSVRIIFVMASPEHVQRITCLAFHNQLIYPGYQWIMVGLTLSDLYTRPSTYQFTYNRLQYICSQGDILSRTLNASMFLYHTFSTEDRTRVVETGISYNEFDILYNDRVKSHNGQLPEEKKQMKITPSFWSSIFYDAVWMWAKVLGEIVRARQFNFTRYNYGNDMLTEIIVDRFFNLTFKGVSGNVTFRGKEEDGFTERIVHLAQVINSSETVVLVLENSTLSSISSEGMIPFLQDTFPKGYAITDSAIVGVFGAIVLLEAIALAALHILTIVYRKHKSIKASSFNLNQLAYLGCYIYIIGLLLSAFNDVDLQTVGPICHVIWAWCYPIAFTIMIGTAVARTWRLYRIFVHYLEPGHLISNGVLIIFILILVAIDVVFATVWTVIDPLRLRLQAIPRPKDRPITSLDYSLHCVSEHHAIWATISFLSVALSVLSLAMLSWMTRRTKQHYSTSSLQLFSYFFAIVFFIGVPVYYIVLFNSSNPNSRFLVGSISMDAILCLYAVCVFVPPLISVFKEKEKKKAREVLVKVTPSLKHTLKRQSTSVTVVL